MTRGFGSPLYNPVTKKEAQSKGGKMSPTNFKNNRELARRAGKLGGKKRKGRSKYA